MEAAGWLGRVPATRLETHFDGRVVRCFADRPASLHDLLAEAVAANPQGEALVEADRRFTWRALEDAVARCAGGLAARGVEPGDRVALLLGNRAEFVVALFAAARLGAIAVPLSLREQAPGLAYLLNDCGARLLVHEDSATERLPEPAALPLLERRISLAGGQGAEPFEALLEASPAAPLAVHEEDAAVLLYTSGTTGRPKGAMLTGLGLAHSVEHYRVCMGLAASDRSLAAVPLSHVTGLVAMIGAMARVAGTLVLMQAFKAADFLALAAAERMTHTILVPAMYNLCLLQPDVARYDLSAWRIGGYGGAPMPVATIERLAELLPGLQLMNAYGSTETTSPAVLMPPHLTVARADCVGLPVPCAEVVAMDEEGREVPPGEPGELWIRGPMVVKGYWNKPEATAEGFVAGFWRSGDLGSVDAEGFVRVFDRKKDMINRGGYKVFTTEVENALAEHPAVAESAVVAKPCPVLGERVHAFVWPREAVPTAEALAAHCRARLADYKVPESFTFTDQPLPRNANGKVMKRQLRDSLPL